MVHVLLILALTARFVATVKEENPECLSLPWNCKCKRPPVLDCAFSTIRELNDTAQLPEGYTGISLSHNDLTNLTAGTTWTNITNRLIELDLSFNDIIFIEDGSFQDLTALRTLHLQHNILRNISSNTWTGLTSITYLDISFNRLRNLPSNVFVSFSELRYLNLCYNPLLKLNAILSPLHSLEQLNLDTTGLAKLSPHVFSNVSKLRILRLNGNVFTDVPTKALSVLKQLTDLDLSDNHFEVVKTKAFQGLVKVQNLTIHNSQALHTIEKYAFDGMKSLSLMSCNFNPHLTSIDSQAFQKENFPLGIYEGQMEEIHLRQNALTTLDQNLLPWMRVRTVDFRENPWNCDCHISWMKKMFWVKLTERTLAIKCNAPPSLHDHLLQNVDLDEFICDEAHHDALTSIILFLTLFSVVVFILSLISCWKLKAFSKCQAAYQQQYRRLSKTPSSSTNAPTEKLELDEAQDL